MNKEQRPFSERYDYAQSKLPQRAGMDGDLRNGLWSVFYQTFALPFGDEYTGEHSDVYEKIFTEFLKIPADEYSHVDFKSDTRVIKNIFKTAQWYEVFNLLEFTINSSHNEYFIERCDAILARENSAYRIIDGLVTEISSKQEREEIKTALNIQYTPARKHIKNALSLFSDRKKPDYENSINESIKAVESIAKEITGDSKATLGPLIKKLDLHPAFAGGLSKLYGFTSDAGGIRHADTPDKYLTIDQDTARFMLVICSSFVNYIISLNPK